MNSINMTSILAKAQKCMDSEEKQKEIRNIVDGIMTGTIGRTKFKTSGDTSIHRVDEAAAKFIEVLKFTISNSRLSSNAVAALSNISHGSSQAIGENTYLIDVYFEDDLSRPSLDAERYGNVTNIAALLNNGVDHWMRPIKGKWHGQETWSRTVIPEAHFIENAAHDFIGNYSYDYNVTNISIDEIYS